MLDVPVQWVLLVLLQLLSVPLSSACLLFRCNGMESEGKTELLRELPPACRYATFRWPTEASAEPA